MRFEEDKFYHVFNRGNGKQKIFFERENYNFFLKKVEKELMPLCSILAYCLMPNHYHLLIYTDKSSDHFKWSDDYSQKVSRKLGTLQSSYTRAINKRYDRSGSLFQQKLKAINLTDKTLGTRAPEICFHYIHQNPFKAGLAKTLDWEFSSFKEYINQSPVICDFVTARNLLNINFNDFENESHQVISDHLTSLLE